MIKGDIKYETHTFGLGKPHPQTSAERSSNEC